MQSTNRDRKRWIILGILCLSLFIISIDNMVLNLALPAISSDLGSSAAELQWIADSYILVFAALLLTMGAIGDRWGRKLLLRTGLVLFGTGIAGGCPFFQYRNAHCLPGAPRYRRGYDHALHALDNYRYFP